MRRAQRRLEARLIQHCVVSILARRMRRAQLFFSKDVTGVPMFQSSPDACAGRNLSRVDVTHNYALFQSSPDACAGRNDAVQIKPLSLDRFNPRPTHAPGATW